MIQRWFVSHGEDGFQLIIERVRWWVPVIEKFAEVTCLCRVTRGRVCSDSYILNRLGDRGVQDREHLPINDRIGSELWGDEGRYWEVSQESDVDFGASHVTLDHEHQEEK